MGNIIGKGSFCEVIELIPFTEYKLVKFEERIVLKQPRGDLDPKQKLKAEECTRNEISLLSVIQHPHIIEFKRKCSEVGSELLGSKNILVLERLYGTLDEKIKYWKNQNTRTHNARNNFRLHPFDFTKRRRRISGQQRHWNERIEICSDIADAMNYLHSHSILLRDLKPENCGFDFEGNVKLFDFGLAVSLSDDTSVEKVDVDNYTFTVSGGTDRYMSPEALAGDSYGKSSEVYTFALVVWEIMSLEKPYSDCKSRSELIALLSNGGRPQLNRKWPKLLTSTISMSWLTNPKARPSFQQLQKQFVIMKIEKSIRKGCGTNSGADNHVGVENGCSPWLCR